MGRNLIERALERAIGILQADAEIDLAHREIAIDRDTLDVPGSPPILDTILGKIDEAAVFLSDLTYVAERFGGGRSPNPNVCIEHGYALKAVSWRRVIAVMNTAQGGPDDHELPFDLRHARRPILFHCPSDADDEVRRHAREELTRGLVVALRAVFGDATVLASLRSAAPTEPHPHDVEFLRTVRKQLSPGLKLFLRRHNFGTPFLMKAIDPLNEINETWVGADYEFHDPELQTSFADVRRLVGELGDLLVCQIHYVNGDKRMGWPKTQLDVSVGLQPSTVAAISAMNAKASELRDAIDAFERTARGRVRVAPISPIGDAAEETGLRREAAAAILQELAFDANRGALPEIVSRPRLTLRLVPWGAADQPRLDPAKVSCAQLRFPPSPQELVCSDADGRQWWSCAPPRRVGTAPNPETAWRLRLVRPGALEYQTVIGQRVDDDPEILIDGLGLEGAIVRNLERMAAIATQLDFGGPALIHVVLDGVEDVQLVRAKAGGRRIRVPEVVLPMIEVSDLSAPMGPALHNGLDILWQTSGWADGSPSFATGDWVGYNDATLYQSLS